MSAWPVFLGITVVLCGFAAFATGRALAGTWRPMWWTAPYCLLLGLVDRFLQWSLFDGTLLSAEAYAADVAVLIVIALFAYRVTQARRMVRQYPWLYARAGLFSWRSIGPGSGDAPPPAPAEKN
jgi:branched-chain amino acid transport system ATP-binding protein